MSQPTRHSAQPKASLYIDGAYVEGEGAALPVHYPYTGETIATLHEASLAQVAQATAAAEDIEDGALQQHVFEAEAETVLGHVLGQRQFQLRLLDPERPFQRRLHAPRAFDPTAARATGPA